MTALETATDTPSRADEIKRAANCGATLRRRSGKGKPRTDLYTEVTAKIVKELEAGRFPWAQPWATRGEAATIAAGLPKNASTRRAYSGINILLLWGAAIENGFSGQTWLTFKQAKALGGSVMKGERGSMVVYADKFIPKDEQARVEKEGGDAAFVPFLKRYTVFNAGQCEGLPPELTAGAKPLPECEAIPRAENLIKATGADFRIGGDRAFYVPSQDFIRVPPQPAFFEQINYYRTSFHELGHNAAFRIMPRQTGDVFFYAPGRRCISA